MARPESPRTSQARPGQRSTPDKMIWAVDPFCQDCTLTRRTARAISVLASQWNVEVEPVYIVVDFPPNVDPLPFLNRDIQLDADRKLRGIMKGLEIQSLSPVKVLKVSEIGLRGQVDELVAYAKESDAELVAVGTHARRGLRRVVLGSFAETLISRSDVPLFVINPHETVPRRLSRILFPTDFSEESRIAFDLVIQFARETDASVTLYHAINYSISPWIDPMLATYPAYIDTFQYEVEANKREAQEWVERARARGIDAEAAVENRMLGSVSEAILNKAGQGGQSGVMIALAAHSGPVTAALLGSVTHQLVRTAPCPIWVIHTERREKARARIRPAA